MKAMSVSKPLHEAEQNFYISHLAPVNHLRETQFRGFDAVLLTVLFLEVAVVMRLLLAH
ncbi:MAG TPA: hypothetical protein VK327_16725 [Candidatus Paceibacterota bacterium]|nr:hypothetical protein [Candidatus Paceibacterota bacterium]